MDKATRTLQSSQATDTLKPSAQGPQRIVGGPGETERALGTPPWEQTGENKCMGGALMREGCRRAGYPVGCGFASRCCNHPAVKSQQYPLVAEAPTQRQADFLGKVQAEDGRYIELYWMRDTEKVVGVAT